MAFDYDKPSTSRFGSLGDHKATILKKVIGDGAIKIYRDAHDTVERIEITVPEGKVVLYKDYEQIAKFSKFKKIDVYSKDEDFLDTLDFMSEDSMVHTYAVYFHRSPIGRAYGDVAMCLASGLIEGSVDPRLLTGSSLDSTVIETIKKILTGKSV